MINLKLKANKASLITITRNNPVDLQNALRKMLDRLDNFFVADIEYTMDNVKSENPTYSAIIMGATPDGYINLTQSDTTDVDNADLTPTDIPDNPSSGQEPGNNEGGNAQEGGNNPLDNPTPPNDTVTEEKLNAIEQKQNETSESIEELKSQMAEMMELLRYLQQNNQNNNG